MKKHLFSLLLALLFFVAAPVLHAQDISQTEKKGFLIVSAGKNYTAMKKKAQAVAKKLNYKLNLRGLTPDKTIGLTFSEKVCEEQNLEYPWYIPRGRYDDGEYVSIEYTTDYNGFTPGYYIIVVSSHSKGDKTLATALKKTKAVYKTAYIKYADVFMGCMH